MHMSHATALQTAAAVEAGSQEFLVFSLGDEEYAWSAPLVGLWATATD